MNPGFQNTIALAVRTPNGHDVVLLEDLVYHCKQGHTYRVPAGSTSDGISTPPVLWLSLPPFGNWWYPGILHDAFYRNTLEIQDVDGGWHKCDITKDYADWLFKEAMLLNDVSESDAEIIFQGVAQFGRHAFKVDRGIA